MLKFLRAVSPAEQFLGSVNRVSRDLTAFAIIGVSDATNTDSAIYGQVNRMVAIPANVLEKMNAQGTVKVLVTAGKAGKPHAIVAGTIMSPAPDKMVIGEVLMHTSVKNLEENPQAAFLISAGMEAWEIDVKNPVRIASGADLDNMNKQLEAIHLHANAMWVFDVDAVYDQGANPNAGKKIA